MNSFSLKFKKIVRYILTGIVIFFILFSLITIIICLTETVLLPLSFSKIGLATFFNYFADFKTLYASTIALVSVYYWIFQMEYLVITNERMKDEKLDKKMEKTLEEARYYHIHIQQKVVNFYDIITKLDVTLFNYEWDTSTFTDESVNNQNPQWELDYDKIQAQVQNHLGSITFDLESLAAVIVNGNIDKELIFKLIGKPFCTQIKILYPFIAGYRSELRKIDYFNNIIELFNQWNPQTN